jgi:hypothetical protein
MMLRERDGLMDVEDVQQVLCKLIGTWKVVVLDRPGARSLTYDLH